MELDDIKNRWNTLDEQLRKESLINENQLSELITKYKKEAHNNLQKLRKRQKFAVYFGSAIIFLFAIILGVIIPQFISDAEIQKKGYILCSFFCVTLIVGLWWDLKTYKWINNTRIDEMPILTVIERINKYKTWINIEVIGISIWTIVFTVLYYFWVMEFHHYPPSFQIVFMIALIIINFTIIYFIYKKLIYHNLRNIRKNLDDLKEIKKR